MPWGAAVGAAIGLGGSLLSDKAAGDRADDAAGAAALQPFSVDSTFGSAQFTPSGITSQAGFGADQAPIFDALTSQFLGQIQGQPLNNFTALSPDQAFAGAQGSNALAQPFTAAGSNFLDAGQGFLGQLGSFNQDEFVNTQFDRLNSLAARGEETAANSVAQRLFSGGRLGGDDSASGVAFGDLARAQEDARTQRGLTAIGLGDDRSRLLADLAGGLTGVGTQTALGGQDIASSDLGRFLGSIQGAGAVSGIQSGITGSLLNQAIQTQGGVQNAQLGERQAIQDALAGAGLQVGAGANVTAANIAGLNNAGSPLASFAGELGGSLIQNSINNRSNRTTSNSGGFGSDANAAVAAGVS